MKKLSFEILSFMRPAIREIILNAVRHDSIDNRSELSLLVGDFHQLTSSLPGIGLTGPNSAAFTGKIDSEIQYRRKIITKGSHFLHLIGFFKITEGKFTEAVLDDLVDIRKPVIEIMRRTTSGSL